MLMERDREMTLRESTDSNIRQDIFQFSIFLLLILEKLFPYGIINCFSMLGFRPRTCTCHKSLSAAEHEQAKKMQHRRRHAVLLANVITGLIFPHLVPLRHGNLVSVLRSYTQFWFLKHYPFILFWSLSHFKPNSVFDTKPTKTTAYWKQPSFPSYSFLTLGKHASPKE